MTRFKNNQGEWVYLLGGREVTEQEYFGQLESGKGEDAPGLIAWKPIESMALGVHPGQVEEANARNKRHGVGVSYSPDGKAHLTSRANRKKLLRLEALHDNSAGYGD